MNEQSRDRSLPELWEFAVRVAQAKGSPDPEAVAQEVVLRLTQLDSWPENPQAWVRRAAQNQVIDDWRKVERRPEEKELGDDNGDAKADTLAWLMSCRPTSAAGMQDMAYAWFHERLGSAFTDDEIRLLTMAAEGLPQSEIAAALGYRSAAVVKTTLARLRKKAAALDRAELEELINHPRPY